MLIDLKCDLLRDDSLFSSLIEKKNTDKKYSIWYRTNQPTNKYTENADVIEEKKKKWKQWRMKSPKNSAGKCLIPPISKLKEKLKKPKIEKFST